MEAHNIGVAEHVIIKRRDFCVAAPIVLPGRHGNGLCGIDHPHPVDGFLQQLHRKLCLVNNVVVVFVRREVHVIGLVVQVPDQHPFVVFKMRNNAVYIIVQAVVAIGIVQHIVTGALHPAGVVNVVFGLWLFAQFRKRIPNGIEQHKHGANAMLMSNGQVFVNAA